MITRKFEPGHYVHDLVEGELDGPWSREQAYAEARRLVDLDVTAPDELEIIHIADVTVLPETLPRGGE